MLRWAVRWGATWALLAFLGCDNGPTRPEVQVTVGFHILSDAANNIGAVLKAFSIQ